MRQSRFTWVKTLEQFDFDFQPSLDRRQVGELAGLSFDERAHNVVILGPPGVRKTHISLFDGSLEGLAAAGRPAFSVQYHPEASPGPQDSHYLFRRFTDLIEKRRTTR